MTHNVTPNTIAKWCTMKRQMMHNDTQWNTKCYCKNDTWRNAKWCTIDIQCNTLNHSSILNLINKSLIGSVKTSVTGILLVITSSCISNKQSLIAQQGLHIKNSARFLSTSPSQDLIRSLVVIVFQSYPIPNKNFWPPKTRTHVLERLAFVQSLFILMITLSTPTYVPEKSLPFMQTLFMFSYHSVQSCNMLDRPLQKCKNKFTFQRNSIWSLQASHIHGICYNKCWALLLLVQ